MPAATRASDVSCTWPPALDALTSTDPALLRMQLAAGATVVESRWPIATVWHAHHRDQPFDSVRAAFEARSEETALVWRGDGFVVHVEALDATDASFTAAVATANPSPLRSMPQALSLLLIAGWHAHCARAG